MRGGRRLALATILVCGTAAADTADDALAQSLFEQGSALMREGRFAEACPKLAESQRLDPGGGTLLNLGLCYEKAEKFTSAYLAYTEVLGLAIREGHKEREQIAQERLAAVQPKLSKVVIRVAPATAKLEGLDVRFDTVSVREVAWGAPTPVDLGEHVLTATAPGRREAKVVVQVKEPGSTVEIVVPELANAPSAPASTPSPTTTTEVDRGRRIAAFTLFGTSLVALGIGVGAGIYAVDQHGKANALCYSDGCDAAYLPYEQTASDAAWVANVAIPVGLVAAGVGAVLFFTSTRTVSVAPAAGGGTVRVRF